MTAKEAIEFALTAEKKYYDVEYPLSKLAPKLAQGLGLMIEKLEEIWGVEHENNCGCQYCQTIGELNQIFKG